MGRRSRYRSFTSVLVVVMLGGAPALAQRPGTTSGPTMLGGPVADTQVFSAALSALFKGHVDEAARAVQEGQHQRAAEAFAAAYALVPASGLLFDLAQMQRKVGHDREVVALLGGYLLQPRAADALRAEAEGYREQARQRLLAGNGGWQEGIDRAELLKSYVGQGVSAHASGEYEQAAAALAMAYALQAEPDLLFNLAKVRYKGERYREALALFGRFLQAAPPESALRAEAASDMAEVQGKLRGLYESAETERRAGRDREAIAGYQRYLSEDPQGPHHSAAEEGLRQAQRRLRPEVERTMAGVRPERQSHRGLRVAKWVLVGAGLAGGIAGATLWVLDGHQSCAKAALGHCEVALQGQTPGIALVVAGGVVLGAAGVLFGVDYGREHAQVQPALLTLSWGK